MFVLGLAPQKIGGVEKFLRLFAIALDGVGWDAVLCFDGPISTLFRDYIALPSVTIVSLDNQGDLGLRCAGRLWLLLRQYKPRAFVYAFHGVMRCFPWLARLSGCKCIFFNDHSSRPPGQVSSPLSLPKRIVGRVLTFPLTGILSVADFTRRTGTAFGITSAPNFVISNGVEVRAGDPALRRQFRERYGVPQDAFVITAVCWLTAVKGVDVLLHAAAELLARRPAAHFLIVGDGPLLEDYRQLAQELGIADAVTFTGLVQNPTAMGVFDATDLYCQPSRWQEACPLAVIEAMSFRLPVVASNVGGLPELVRDGVTGLLVMVDAPDLMAKALERIASEPELRDSMGEAAYRAVLQRHRIEDTVRSYINFLIADTPKLR
jgi:glycosyltransferase involved in cell wall biosynthesis